MNANNSGPHTVFWYHCKNEFCFSKIKTNILLKNYTLDLGAANENGFDLCSSKLARSFKVTKIIKHLIHDDSIIEFLFIYF